MECKLTLMEEIVFLLIEIALDVGKFGFQRLVNANLVSNKKFAENIFKYKYVPTKEF